MRANYCFRGAGVPDGQMARLMGVDQFFWDAYGVPQLPTWLIHLRFGGWKVGINRNTANSEWPDSPTDPVAFGQKCSQDLTDLGCDGLQCSVLMDIELHNAEWILAALKAFRAKRNGRYLYWTCEPFQAGWISPALRDFVNRDPYTWMVPQAYRGSMAPVSERACLDYVTQAGFSDEKVKIYYDRWEEGFDGILYGAVP